MSFIRLGLVPPRFPFFKVRRRDPKSQQRLSEALKETQLREATRFNIPVSLTSQPRKYRTTLPVKTFPKI